MDGRSDRKSGALALLLVVLLGTSAHAQSNPQAEKLFRDGKALMKDGRHAEACPLFESSQKLESSIATVMSLADCLDKRGAYASAWGWFLQAKSMTRDDQTMARTHQEAERRAAALEPRLSYLTINVPDESRVPGLVVTRDGVAVASGAWNRAVPVDGGEHLIEGKAPGHEAWTTRVTVAPERDQQAVEVPRFKALPELAEPGNGTTVTQVTMVDRRSRLTARRKVAIGVAGGGLALIVGGAVLGFQAQTLRDDAEAACPPQSCTPDGAAAANALDDRARTRALLANLGYGLGGAAIAAGVVLWVIGAPRDAEQPTVTVLPSLGRDHAGVAALVRF